MSRAGVSLRVFSFLLLLRFTHSDLVMHFQMSCAAAEFLLHLVFVLAQGKRSFLVCHANEWATGLCFH